MDFYKTIISEINFIVEDTEKLLSCDMDPKSDVFSSLLTEIVKHCHSLSLNLDNKESY